jgi:hypothetical protein
VGLGSEVFVVVPDPEEAVDVDPTVSVVWLEEAGEG